MKDSLKQFYNQHSPARAAALSSETKQKIKFSLMSKIKNMPREETNQTLKADKEFLVYLKNTKSLLSKNYVIVPLAIILMVGGTTIASANSLPGDALYPVKRSVETFTVMIAPSEQEKTDLQIKYAQKRIVELETLEQRGAISKDDEANDANDSKTEKATTDSNSTAKNDTDQNSDKNQSSDDRNKSNIESFQKATPQSQNGTKSNSKSRKYRSISPQVQKQIKEEVNNARKFINQCQRDHSSQSSTNTESGFKIQETQKKDTKSLPNLRFDR